VRYSRVSESGGRPRCSPASAGYLGTLVRRCGSPMGLVFDIACGQRDSGFAQQHQRPSSALRISSARSARSGSASNDAKNGGSRALPALLRPRFGLDLQARGHWSEPNCAHQGRAATTVPHLRKRGGASSLLSGWLRLFTADGDWLRPIRAQVSRPRRRPLSSAVPWSVA
jgi:hypothetical protein